VIDGFLDRFADTVGPHLPATELPTHLKLVRLILGAAGVMVAIFGIASIPSAAAGDGHGPGLTSTFPLIPMAFEGNWLSVATAPFAAISAIVGTRLSMTPGRLRAAAVVCLGWAIVSLVVSVSAPESRVLGAIAMVLMAGSLLNAVGEPRNAVLAPRSDPDRH
jgi:hypothetical protein